MKQSYENGVIPQSSEQARRDMARQLKAARKSQNLTQQSLADRAGTKKSNISRLESGNYNPSLDFLVKVAESMGKKVEIDIR